MKGEKHLKEKHLREALREREGPKKKKYQRGNNPWQESSKKLRVKRTERKKESGKKKRGNTVGIEACINRPSFPSLLANPLFEDPQK